MTKQIQPNKFTVLIVLISFRRKLTTTKIEAKYPTYSDQLFIKFNKDYKPKQFYKKSGHKVHFFLMAIYLQTII